MQGLGLELWAHTPADNEGCWHSLRGHLLSVASTAGAFGRKFGAEQLCFALGLAHDLAKADPRFQAYLRACHEGQSAPKCPHADASALAVYDALKVASMAVLGHHSGLPNSSDAKQRLQRADPESVRAARCFAEEFVFPDQRLVEAEMAQVRGERELEFFLRMSFSALVDADFLDTEAHFNAALPIMRRWDNDLSSLSSRLRTWLGRFAHAQGTVNDARRDVLSWCRQAASGPQGAFRLTVPTGGGKTLSSLTFALDHAVHHGLDRVIVAIPFTSIIDQTASVYEEILGEESILEHHSAAEPDETLEAMSVREHRCRLGAENWDAPIVVTTTVQLFESLFANRTSKCRKLHNIARSVLILDEVQTLPVELLAPTLDVLEQLIAKYGVTVVFCTATQPDYSMLDTPLLAQAKEIVPEPERHFQALKRVEYRRLERPVTREELSARVTEQRQAMCILNSRSDAVEVARACGNRPDLFHLSTLMCSDHRKSVLSQVRDRLKQNLPCLLVSTQVVEAGVDLDFPVVYRALAPLDRIVQAAGRCNREGRLQQGECIVFELEGGRQPKGIYRTGTDLARTVIEEYLDALDQPAVVTPYFYDLYGMTEQDSYKIQPERARLNYETTASRYRLIQEGSQSLVALHYAEETIRPMLERAKRDVGREVYRRLGRYMVSVPFYEFEQFRNQGLVHEHETGVFIYTGPYDNLWGIGIGTEHDPTDLVG